MRILKLTLSKLPFDVMVTGEKNVEYRTPSKWILSRLRGKEYDVVRFSNGYSANSPYFIAKFNGWDFCALPGYSSTYSNGLEVDVPFGTVRIFLGKIMETGNLKDQAK